MIDRFYLKEFLSFNEVDIELEKGLIVFSGPSGAGKSVLMSSILSLFGKYEARASLSEVSLLNDKIEDDAFGIENDDFTIKQIKKDKVRYFLNNQTISKKNLSDFSKKFIKHLHLKDISDFENEKLIELLDLISIKKDKKYKKQLDEFKAKYFELSDIRVKLNKILEDEKKLEELKEFAKYEIDKISNINPKEGELEELLEIKTQLSKKDKINEAIEEANGIFEYSHRVSTALSQLDVDGSFFDDAINEVNNIFEKFNDNMAAFEDIDIEETLDRVEQLKGLEKRFGSITETLEYKKQKEIELEGYDNISFEKEILIKNEKKISALVLELAAKITKVRKKSADELQKLLNHYLGFLYLEDATVDIIETKLNENGLDEVVLELKGVSLDTISSGEFNRLRLALLSAKNEFDVSSGGVLFLDEIDANLSGKESGSIAKLLKHLTTKYQIFAISHQPQLTSSANQHIYVEKIDGNSTARSLDEDEKIIEIARMISDDTITEEAIEFARKMKYEQD